MQNHKAQGNHEGHAFAVNIAEDPFGNAVYQPYCTNCREWIGGWRLCSFGLHTLEAAERIGRHVTRIREAAH